MASIRLRVQWTEQTAVRLGPQGFRIPWTNEELKIRCSKPPLTIDDIGKWIEERVEGMYDKMSSGQDAQAQVISIRRKGSQNTAHLPWEDNADQHLKSGNTIIVDCLLATGDMAARQPEFTEEALKRIRESLRFSLNDRVLCYCGPRWFSGLIVGTAVPDEDEVLPYLVKTDPLPGLPSRTISVPSDRDELCMQEVCFNPRSQLDLVKTAAKGVKDSARPKLRFAAGDKVVVRIHNSIEDGLEQWVKGTVDSTWPKLGVAPEKWEIGGVSGEFPNIVPYKVNLCSGSWVYCHHDHFTLIRRAGMQPQTRVKGISKRMEVVQTADGSREKVDHHTERRKRMHDPGEVNDDSD